MSVQTHPDTGAAMAKAQSAVDIKRPNAQPKNATRTPVRPVSAIAIVASLRNALLMANTRSHVQALYTATFTVVVQHPHGMVWYGMVDVCDGAVLPDPWRFFNFPIFFKFPALVSNNGQIANRRSVFSA